MAKALKKIEAADEEIVSKIYFIRDKKIMLDKNLAELYDVTTGNLNKAVKRNLKRFPEDFMFQLTEAEFKNLIFQSGTSSWGGTRKMPYGFTEQGVAMLSGVLNSERAIEVNIRIIRIFTKLREMLLTHKDILVKLEKIENELMKQDSRTAKNEDNIQMIFEALKQLLNPPQEPRQRIGFKP
ncbi:ORF6N domain-containing protein [Mucilaginibacter sp.]|uniref:ORF6N domain-containing protein n=1 Tax=Mucilaginibacter sp. TaxID=1882438 RepID=UPI003264E6E6